MPAKAFEVGVRQQPPAAIVDLHGEINAFAEERLNAAYVEADARDPEVILLNFSDVDYINSTGIALIVGLLARARASHRKLLACGLGEHYAHILELTRLNEAISIFGSEAEALAAAA